MGTLTTGPVYTPQAWHRHEGHPGWQINTISNILAKSLATSPTPPDLITIHLGTNDCNAGVNTTAMVGRMNLLLSQIATAVPKAQVFLADVVGTGNTWNDCIVKFNAGEVYFISFHSDFISAVSIPPMAHTHVRIRWMPHLAPYTDGTMGRWRWRFAASCPAVEIIPCSLLLLEIFV